MHFSDLIARRRIVIGAMAGLVCVAPHVSALDEAAQSPPNAVEVLAHYQFAGSPEDRIASQQDDTSDEVGVRTATNGEAVTPSRHWRTIVRELVIAGPARPVEKRPVRRLRFSNLNNAPDPHVEAARGLYGSHAPAGSQNQSIDSYLYSSRFIDSWRAFLHTHVIDAKYGGSEVEWNRLGAGFEYRRPIWRMTGELNSNLDGSRRSGGNFTTRWRASDHLRLRGSFEAHSNAVPLDARLAHVSGNRRALECVYRVNDGRSFDLTYSVIDFTDSNRRATLKANWKERWDIGPRARLSATLEAHDTRNSLADAKYFNPADDTTVIGSTTFDYLYWRDGKRSFSQRINLLAGSYLQHGYHAEPIWAGEYRHIVQLRAGMAMSYGVRRSLHPYDGKQSARNAGNVELSWAF